MRLYILIILIIANQIALSQPYKSFKIKASTYSIYLNSNQGYFSNSVQYDENENILIRSVNAPKSAIEGFSLSTNKLAYSIPLNYKVSSFFKLKNNTYWVHDVTNRSYKLIDKKGKTLKTLKEQNYDQNTVYINTSPNIFAPIVIYKNDLYVTGNVRFKEPKKLDLEKYKRTGIMHKIKSNGQTEYLLRAGTKSLSNFYGNMNNYSLTYNHNIIYIAPYFSDEIQALDLNKGLVKKITLKTKYESKIIPLSKLNKASLYSNRESNEYYKRSYSFVGFVYDKFRDVYYRFIRFPLRPTHGLDCIIIVYNKQFQPLFETSIDSKKYNVSQHFITKNGIYFLNLESYKKDDSKLSFDLFTLAK